MLFDCFMYWDAAAVGSRKNDAPQSDMALIVDK